MPEINTQSDRNMVEGQPQSSPNETVVNQAAQSPPAAAAASDFKYGVGSHVSVEVLGGYGKGYHWRSALAMILLLFVTSLAQAVLASAIRRQGIQVESFPIAGNPAIGFLALGVAACFAILAVLDKKDNGEPWVKGVKMLATAYSSITLGVMAIWSFGERAVYLELHRYEQCMTAIGSATANRGKCICWDDDESDGTSVDLASNSDISCGGVLEYVGDILGSYVLMVAILVLTVAGLWYKPYRSKPITTDIVLEADPTPYVVGRTNPATQWGKYKTGQVQ